MEPSLAKGTTSSNDIILKTFNLFKINWNNCAIVWKNYKFVKLWPHLRAKTGFNRFRHLSKHFLDHKICSKKSLNFQMVCDDAAVKMIKNNWDVVLEKISYLCRKFDCRNYCQLYRLLVGKRNEWKIPHSCVPTTAIPFKPILNNRRFVLST